MAIVTIEGQLILPSGNGPTDGAITATLSANAVNAGGDKVLGRSIFRVPSGGDLGAGASPFLLEANDVLTPSGTYYHINYALYDSDGRVHTIRELWDVSGSGTQDVGDITVLGTAGSVYPGVTDTDAYHESESAEISGTPEKLSPVNADLVLIEDSSDSYSKKKVQVGNLPGGGGGGGGAYTVYTTTGDRPPLEAGNAYVPFVLKEAGEHAKLQIIYQRDDDSYAYWTWIAPF